MFFFKRGGRRSARVKAPASTATAHLAALFGAAPTPGAPRRATDPKSRNSRRSRKTRAFRRAERAETAPQGVARRLGESRRLIPRERVPIHAPGERQVKVFLVGLSRGAPVGTRCSVTRGTFPRRCGAGATGAFK